MTSSAWTLLIGAVMLWQTAVAQVASNVRVAGDDGGPVYATIDAQERKIAPFAFKAWIVDSGHAVVYSGRGSGGFESEGQTLYRYDLRARVRRRILAEPFQITNVEEAVSRTGKPAYLVSMEDGGLGATHIAVVDAHGSEVFRRDGAKFSNIERGSFTVDWYNDEDWTKMQNQADIKPARTRKYDLDQVMERHRPAPNK